MAGRMQMGREAQKQQDLQSKYDEYISRLLDKEIAKMDTSDDTGELGYTTQPKML